MGFSRKEYRSGLAFPPPGNLSDPGIKPASLASPALAGGVFTTEPPGKPSGGSLTYQRKGTAAKCPSEMKSTQSREPVTATQL